MEVSGKKIGFVLTGSFSSLNKVIEKMKKLKELGADIIPIMSNNCYEIETRFGEKQDFISKIEKISKREIIHTIIDAEPIGPKHLTDILIIAPASGNTIAKLASDIIDTPATMAVKSHLRNELPVVIAPATDSGLGASIINIGILLNRKHYYFVPFRQDNPITKPRSLVFDPNYIVKTIEFALDKEQIEPIIL